MKEYLLLSLTFLMMGAFLGNAFFMGDKVAKISTQLEGLEQIMQQKNQEKEEN